MQKFKIFYSWQSDLPASKTRNFIRECIDEAILLAEETETIEAVRDEATTDTTGSPNIVTTLFAKIDDCDLLVADLSLCYTEKENGVKKSPNPNVLIELGYAVKTLGWDRIICLCNTDYGNEYPFDVAHNRIASYSLEGKSKKEIKTEIWKIIFFNIRALRKLPPRSKTGFATHLLGMYNFRTHSVEGRILPPTIDEQDKYRLHNTALLNLAHELVGRIDELTAEMKRLREIEEATAQVTEDTLKDIFSQDDGSALAQVINANAAEDMLTFSKTRVNWKDVTADQERIRRWLQTEVNSDFFDLGSLRRSSVLRALGEDSLDGTSEEVEKYDKLLRLSSVLYELEVRENYPKTFEGMCFIPLAIQNISSISDDNIRIVIKVDVGDAVDPDENLIWDEYQGLQGLICSDDDEPDSGVIEDLFSMPEDGVITVEQEPFDASSYIHNDFHITLPGMSRPDKNEKDYRTELECFIASTEGKDHFTFSVDKLRPGECKWLSTGLLIRPINNKIVLHYQIHSSHSLGNLSNVLELDV